MEGVKKFKNTDYTLYLVKNKNLKQFENDIKEKYKNLFTKHSTIVVKNILELQDKSELLETISKYNYNRFSKYKNVSLIKGYFEETVKDKNVYELFENEKGAIIFIDCDLMNPSIIALNFIKPILQIGSIIILDDYWSYKANPSLGVAGAFNKFLNDNENIKVKRYFDYGIGGTSFIIENL